MLSPTKPPDPDLETQEGPPRGAFWPLLLMYFYSGPLMQFYSGVDTLGMVEMAGELGDGIMLYLCPLSRLPKAYAALEKGATKAGRSFSSIDITTGLPICISDDLKAARDAARESLVFYGMLPFYNKLFRYSGFEQEAAALAKGDGSGVSERMIDELYLVGSPERCRERLAAFRAAAIQLPIILPVPVAGQSYGQAARKAIAAFA
jgi:alkanesulfonate monooxygenase SsuD/methylene tetrahydromethanopterin reductase-like flavin-dependent oxidoreductase (luciferase family)